MTRYRDDPRWITTRHSGTCHRCGAFIRKGDDAFYYPKHRRLYCKEGGCGGAASRDFEAGAADEDLYHRRTGGW